MNDNKWVVKLDRLGKNLDYIKKAEKQIRQHQKHVLTSKLKYHELLGWNDNQYTNGLTKQKIDMQQRKSSLKMIQNYEPQVMHSTRNQNATNT